MSFLEVIEERTHTHTHTYSPARFNLALVFSLESEFVK